MSSRTRRPPSGLGRWGLRLLPLAAAALLVPACGKSDDTPLDVTFLSPVNGEASVPRQPVLYIRFDRALNPATVTSTNVVLANAGGPVSAPVSYAAYLNEIRMVPAAALDAATPYQVTLTSGIAGADGTTYAGGYYQFTTSSSGDIIRPSFSGAASAGNPAQTTIDLAWVDPEPGLTYDVFLSTATGNYDFTDPYVSVSSPGGTTVTDLAAGTTYYFVVRARDASGNTDLNEVQRSAATLP